MGDQEKCKKRFKGIENFLRRVAFNLGNTPSQTEVKIISCIPIDVTDLQQKIIYLEKQLEESKNADTDPNEAVVQTALLPTGFPRPSSRGSGVTKTSYEHFADNASKPRKSVVSFTCPSVSPKCHMETESHTPDFYTKDDPPHVTTACRKALFQKKKAPKKKKVNTHLVYYAQTNEFNNPFNNTEPVMPKLRTPKEIDTIGRSFLTDMVRRQYRPAALDKFSDTTQFSSPICRDFDPDQFKPLSKESDICSCCHGPFHNIDNQRTHDVIFPNQLLADETHVNDRGAYYDSSLYDLIPVKENPMKIKRDTESKRKDIKRMANIKGWPEHVRTHPRLLTVNYLTHAPNYRQKELTNIYARKEILNRKSSERKQVNKVVRNVNMESSNGCIDLGEVYIKPVIPKVRSPNIVEPPTPLHKNAECLTTVINNTECQTITTKSIELVSPPHEDKTEETLNQIKSILQSVLIEVKTNTQLHTNVEEKQKKDAVVQKGPSQSNVMGMSGLLNSFTYSPYNMSPYLSSCSRHIPSNSFCFNGMPPGKCLQNYPLFIQTPGRKMCAGCFRNSSHVSKTDPQYKRAATTATNTKDSNEKHSKETEKLIKEIYKSMALTMDIPTKDASGSECNEFNNLKSTIVESTEKHDTKVLKEYINSRKENSIPTVQPSQPERKKETGINPLYRSRQSPIVATFKTTLPPQDVSKHSQEMSTDTDSQLRKERIGLYLQNTKITPRSTETELGVQDLGAHSPVSTVSEEEEEETESSSSEEDSDDTYVPPKETVTEKKGKKGLFCKMFKSVFKSKEGKSTKGYKEGSVTGESEVSDSDDYQTIYSQRVEPPPKRVVHQPRPTKPHSKLVTTKQPYHKEHKPEKKKRTPYMEQEYRRHWNENLMFHENQKRQYSSEKPVSRKTSPPMKHQSPYYRNYEARSVLHDPYIQYQKEYNTSMQRRNPMPIQVQQHYVRQGNQTQPHNYPTPVDTVPREQKTPRVREKTAAKGMAWLKKHKLGIHCGEQWKKLLLDS